jgi:hypothetical protein
MFSDGRFKEFPTVSIEPRECSFLVRTHEPAVAGNIRRENCCEPPFHALFGHVSAPAGVSVRGIYGRPSPVSMEAIKSAPGQTPPTCLSAAVRSPPIADREPHSRKAD